MPTSVLKPYLNRYLQVILLNAGFCLYTGLGAQALDFFKKVR